MTSQTINALGTSPLPIWLVVVLCVVIFVAVSVLTGYLTYKYRINRLKGVQDTDENRSDK